MATPADLSEAFLPHLLFEGAGLSPVPPASQHVRQHNVEFGLFERIRKSHEIKSSSGRQSAGPIGRAAASRIPGRGRCPQRPVLKRNPHVPAESNKPRTWNHLDRICNILYYKLAW
jgi:hypothetical protein